MLYELRPLNGIYRYPDKRNIPLLYVMLQFYWVFLSGKSSSRRSDRWRRRQFAAVCVVKRRGDFERTVRIKSSFHNTTKFRLSKELRLKASASPPLPSISVFASVAFVGEVVAWISFSHRPEGWQPPISCKITRRSLEDPVRLVLWESRFCASAYKFRRQSDRFAAEPRCICNCAESEKSP